MGFGGATCLNERACLFSPPLFSFINNNFIQNFITGHQEIRLHIHITDKLIRRGRYWFAEAIGLLRA
ncbi:hypothetical protein VNO80_08106 [Phaseolus coccineus]|uniref:Uncharacterized protein n=1 Tax=Phaseolus coccineus TaxID=3886 RepID=A0AAN9NJV7_PHACN